MNILSNLCSLFCSISAKEISTARRNQIGCPIALFISITAITLSGCGNPQVSFNEASPSSVQNSDRTSNNPSDVLELKFGVYTADKPTTVVKQFRPMLDILENRMSENLGKSVEIKIKVDNTYEKGIQSLVQGKVDFSRLGPVSYVEAKGANPELSILACLLYTSDAADD